MSALAFEEHGEVLDAWRAAGWSGATVVVFDRHLDLKRIAAPALTRVRDAARASDLRPLNRTLPFQDDGVHPFGLDNFLYAAIDLGLVRRIVWVAPEPRPIDDGGLARMLWAQLSLLAGHGDEVRGSFHGGPAGVGADVGGARVELTTLRRLPALGLPPDAHVDIDLDFFGCEDGRLLHTPDAMVAAVQACGLARAPPTVTFSASSGFLHPSLRWLGEATAAGLGFRLEPCSARANPAAEVLRRVAAGTPVEPAALARIWSEVLAPLGGAGASLAAVLALQIPDLVRAETLYHEARALGDGAHWPAYCLALRAWTAGDLTTARAWLQRAQGPLLDTLQLHALCLEALCAARLGAYEEALAVVARCIEHAPLRSEVYRVGVVAATQLGREAQAQGLRAALAAVDRAAAGSEEVAHVRP